jgi:putative ABC transport system permease protein
MTIKVAVKTLLRNKLRTFLTMLGIIFGVGAVVAMLSIGEGAKKKMLEEIDSLGTNVISVFSWVINKEGKWEAFSTLTLEDGLAIKKEASHVIHFSPEFNTKINAAFENNNWDTDLIGVSTDYPIFGNWKTSSGRFFLDSEVKTVAPVAVIGNKVRQELFGSKDPLGKIIRLKRAGFRVIGILESRGQMGWFTNADDIIMIPYTTYTKRVKRVNRIWSLTFAATSREDSEKARDEITSILRQRHRLKEGMEDDFTIRTQEDRVKNAEESNKILTTLLGSIGFVSLLVGGIGIMNIMLVSVTERMREIGIRMALGARQRDILLQFLVEAAIISILGGVMGLGLGALTAFLFKQFSSWKTYISPNSVFISMFFSIAIGIFFGFYPAWKASKLDPIKTLRME